MNSSEADPDMGQAKKEPQEMSRGSHDEVMSLLPFGFFTFHLHADAVAAEARTSFLIIEPVCV